MRRRRLIFCQLGLLLLLISNVVTQDDDDEDAGGEDEDDDDSGNYINSFDNFDNNYFPMGSDNYEELPGGVFDADSDGDPIDYMDSTKNNHRVSPRFSIPSLIRSNSREHDTLLNRGNGPLVHAPQFDFPEHQEDRPVVRNDPNLLNAHPFDSYDPDRRQRYAGYDEEHEGSPASQEEATSTSRDMNQDYDRFPRGSFLEYDGFPGDPKRVVHDRRFPQFKMNLPHPSLPCDGDCNK